MVDFVWLKEGIDNLQQNLLELYIIAISIKPAPSMNKNDINRNMKINSKF